MAEIKVADISRWQGIINWDEFKNHIQGVVIKASGADGGLYVDSLLARNRDEARRVGVPVWFYHFKGAGSARQQAEHLVAAVGGLREGEALVLDDENEGKVNVGFAAEFADRIKELTGLTIVIYSNQSRFSGVDLGVLAAKNIGAWVAKYGMNTGDVAGAGSPASISGLPMIMWQYTSTARVPGVSANTVDMNVFYGDQGQFKAYGAKNNVPAPSAPAPAPAPAPSVGNGTYVVVSGDTLSGIGAKLGQNWQTIASQNGITAPYTIFPGQVLKVYGGSAQAATPVPTGETYTVVGGDTLSGIGVKTGRDWRAIASANGINAPFTIYPGQVLKLSGGSAPAPAAPPAPVPTYTVRPGDYLSAIGPRVGIAWTEIARLNGIAPPYTIYPNQVLKLK